MKSNKVCSIVFNSVSRDARVLKEAQSLAQVGYEVTILGIIDEKFSVADETLGNSVRVRRVCFRTYRTFIFSMLKLISLISLIILISLFKDKYATELLIFFQLLVFSGLIYFLRESWKRLSAKRNNDSEVLGKKKAPSWFAKFWMYLRVVPFLRMLWVERPAIVHCHDIQTLPLGVIAKLLLRCKLVYDAHEIYEEVPQVLLENGARLRSFRRIHKFSQAFVDEFITINESIAAWYAEKYPKLPKAIVIMNATPLSPEVQYDGRLHKAAGVEIETNILLYQGGFAEHRGLGFLVKSAEHLPGNWVLVMMGWGAHEGPLKRLADAVNKTAHDSGRGDVVKFIPPAPQSELVMWTAGGAIGVIPYENTGLNHWFCTPNKIWELPNAGLPVLVSPFPELRKSVDIYKNGWLLPESEDLKFIGSLISSLTQKQLKEASENSRKFIEANHWSLYERRLIDLYSKLT